MIATIYTIALSWVFMTIFFVLVFLAYTTLLGYPDGRPPYINFQHIFGFAAISGLVNAFALWYAGRRKAK